MNKLTLAREIIITAIKNDKPLFIGIHPGGTPECKEVYLDKYHVLSVLNYYTFPVTAMLDSITLSQQGKLDDALDVRPFMFSGPAPTMAIWSGTDVERIKELGYPSLTDSDAEAAFAYWLRYVFGITLNEDWKLS